MIKSLFLLLFSEMAFASVLPAYEIDASGDYFLLPDLEFQKIENSGNLEILERKNLPWERNKGNVLNFGFSEFAYLARFRLHNHSKQKVYSYIEIGYPLLDSVDVYVESSSKTKKIQLGDKYSFATRPIKFHNFLVPVEVEPAEEVAIYIHFNSKGPVILPVKVWAKDKLLEDSTESSLGYGLYFGIMIAIIAYNVFLYLTSLSTNYLYYIGYLFFFSLFQGSAFGHFFRHIWPDSIYWNSIAYLFSISMSGLFLSLFTNSFLNSHLEQSPFKLVCKTVAALYFLNSLLVVGLDYAISARTTASLVIPLMVAVGANMIFRYYTGYRPARFFTLAFLLLVLGSIIYTLRAFGVFPSNTFTDNAPLLGSAVDAILLSLALGDKVKYEQRQARQEINNKNKDLEQQHRKNHHLISELKKLVFRHQLSMIQEGKRIEETMPQDTKEAVIIAFDIQDSSQIGHGEHHTFFESVLKNCNRAMMASYDHKSLHAGAYMIKEMGDGFLCSVGFPFKCQGQKVDSAFQLAEIFIGIFMSQVEKSFETPQYCGVGISLGKVAGYFPKTGLKQYDLYGNAIAHATRYEAMRKHLFQNGVKRSNIIIIQEKIYERLSENLKSELNIFELGDFRVRDDIEASKLFYKQVFSDYRDLESAS